ncbi:MAG: (E)-4-hydroxy-3-methylbut-2-enyl-diphosphate synthase [Bacteroidota bacterium]
MSVSYCDDLFAFNRFLTREVNIGNIPMGGANPIRIQSMTNTDTMDTEATVLQSVQMIKAGSEYVRITAQGIKEANNLAEIKNQLLQKGYSTPLIADIHFNPKAAEVAAAIVEKVRINPGNYVDRNIGKFHFTDLEYNDELKRIADRLFPLIAICKQHHTAIRIGTNHGSLSERIMSRYGDTPKGMVESAMEFITICKGFDFNDIILSMKSSNIKVMVQSTRLLVARMKEEGMNYPIHLGVTEAGDGEDGRIKSAGGIGALLQDGIGDTIRVSLTEDPELELPVARKIVDFTKCNSSNQNLSTEPYLIDPFNYNKRNSISINNIGGNNPVQIYLLEDLNKETTSKNYLIVTKSSLRGGTPKQSNDSNQKIDCFTSFAMTKIASQSKLNSINPNDIIVFDFKDEGIKSERLFFSILINKKLNNPVIVKKIYSFNKIEDLQIKAAIDFSSLLVDGLCDGICIENPYIDKDQLKDIMLAVLQATGVRITKTEYISCPSCGRTQFKIQDGLKDIRKRTSHLKGLKIAVMGCIVNGPGEMADAHYGYVGAGNGKINLYKGKEVIEKNIDEALAVDALINLIKQNGDWKES